MKEWLFKIVVGVIFVSGITAGFSVGLNRGFDAGYIKGQEASFDSKESRALQGCETAAMQMRKSSWLWRKRAEECALTLQELFRQP